MSYQAPAALKKLTYVVTLADLQNATPVILNGVTYFLFVITSDASFNGQVEFEIQLTDQTWDDMKALIGASDIMEGSVGTITRGGTFVNTMFANGNLAHIIPFNIRFRISTKATIGTATITVFYQ